MSFEALIDWLAAASAVITAINIYLMVNKIWGRKHIRDVAESISVAAYSMSFLLAVPFVIKFVMLEGDLVASVSYGLWMVFYAIFVLIGTGVWVVGKPGLGFLQKFRSALSMEGNELGTIVKAFSKPTASNHVLRILGGVAGIDRDFDDRERDFIMAITKNWGMQLSEAELFRLAQAQVSFHEIREDVTAYLQTRPPMDEASQLFDLVNHMVRADETVSAEEQLLLDEIEALVGNYIADDDGQAAARFEVLVVPQDDDQFAQIADLLKERNSSCNSRLGGRAYPLGSFFSEGFAEAITAPIREKGLFCVVHRRTDA